MTIKQESKRNKDIYLVVADHTKGFQLALRYVARIAKENGVRMGVLHVMDEQDIQPWAGVARHLSGAQRKEADLLLAAAAKKAYEIAGLVPCIYIEEGGRFEKVLGVINQDSNIRKLVLGAEPHSANPGPLVSYFTGKGLAQLQVPLTVIPGNLTSDIVDDMA